MGVHEESRAGLGKLQRILFHKRIAVEDLVVLLPLGKRLTRMVLGLVVDLHTPRWRGELEIGVPDARLLDSRQGHRIAVLHESVEGDAGHQRIGRLIDLEAGQLLGVFGKHRFETHRFGDKVHDIVIGLRLEKRINAFLRQLNMVVAASHNAVLHRVLELRAYRQHHIGKSRGILVVHAHMQNEVELRQPFARLVHVRVVLLQGVAERYDDMHARVRIGETIGTHSNVCRHHIFRQGPRRQRRPIALTAAGVPQSRTRLTNLPRERRENYHGVTLDIGVRELV